MPVIRLSARDTAATACLAGALAAALGCGGKAADSTSSPAPASMSPRDAGGTLKPGDSPRDAGSVKTDPSPNSTSDAGAPGSDPGGTQGGTPGTDSRYDGVEWQYMVPVAGATNGARAYLWIPPSIERIRGVIIAQMTLIEMPFVQDPLIRAAAADAGLAIVFVNPSFDSTFNYKSGADRTLSSILSDLANVSGYPELAEAPLMPAGHSTGGIFAHNVAYWSPRRTIAVLHIKSGNIKPPDFDPGASFSGVPFLAINGQFEEFGPDGDVPAGQSRELQWHTVRDTLLALRSKDPKQLCTLLVEPGAGHFAWSERLARFVALYIRKAAAARLGDTPDGKSAVVALDPERGWLGDAALSDPQHQPPAPYAAYAGDKAKSFYFFDEETARATEMFEAGQFGLKDQMVTFSQDGQNLDPVARLRLRFDPIGDGQSFRVTADYLDKYPVSHPLAGQTLGHGPSDVAFRVVRGAAVATAPNEFRVQFDTFGIDSSSTRIIVMASAPIGSGYRYTEQPGEIRVPVSNTEGAAQTISFDAIADRAATAAPLTLHATSSAGLPVRFYVAYGPASVNNGVLTLSPLPRHAKLPIEVAVVAYQWGKPIDPKVQTAVSVQRTFRITAR